MNRSRRHLLSVAVLLVIVATGATVAALALSGRAALTGELHHDFGIVELSDQGARVEHVFRLTNESEAPVTIGRVKSSCGCAAAKPSTETVEPGETVEIPVSLLIKASVHKNATITLDLNERGTQALTVAALGRRAEQLFIRRPTLEIAPNGTAGLNIYLELDDDSTPGTLGIVSSTNQLAASIGSWKQTRQRNTSSGQPAVWLVPFEVRHLGGDLPEGAAVTITLDEQRKVEVPVVREEVTSDE